MSVQAEARGRPRGFDGREGGAAAFPASSTQRTRLPSRNDWCNFGTSSNVFATCRIMPSAFARSTSAFAPSVFR